MGRPPGVKNKLTAAQREQMVRELHAMGKTCYENKGMCDHHKALESHVWGTGRYCVCGGSLFLNTINMFKTDKQANRLFLRYYFCGDCGKPYAPNSDFPGDVPVEFEPLPTVVIKDQESLFEEVVT